MNKLFYRCGALMLCAIAMLSVAAGADPADQHKQQGNVFWEAKQYGKAAREFREAIRLRPRFPKAHNNLGGVYSDAGRYSLAIPELKEAIYEDPNYAHAYYNLALVYVRMRQPSLAVPLYIKSARLDPTDPDTFVNLGNAYEKLMQWNNALPVYRTALRLAPKDWPAHEGLAVALVHTGHEQDALREYQQVFAANPDSSQYAEAYYNVGHIFADQGEHEKAVSAYQHASRLQPRDPRIFNNLGTEYILMRQYAQSVAALQIAVRIAPVFPEAHYNLGNAFAGMGNRPAARREWQTVLTQGSGFVAKAARGKLTAVK